jgi:hypothetical protein
MFISARLGAGEHIGMRLDDVSNRVFMPDWPMSDRLRYTSGPFSMVQLERGLHA